MEQETRDQYRKKISELEKQLTKRNQQYVFDLKKHLTAGKVDSDVLLQTLHDILPQMVAGQKVGKPARQLFGTVTEFSEKILHKPKPEPKPTFAKMWLDNSLLMFAFLCLVSAVLALLSSKNNQTAQYGILTILFGAVSGGYVFYLMDHYIYQYTRPGADPSKKPGFLKMTGITILVMFAWFIVFGIAALIPSKINVVFDPVIDLAIAAVVFGIRYYLRKNYGIRGTLWR